MTTSGILDAARRWVWDVDAFLSAEAAGVFGERQVELIDGEVRVVVHGKWHGRVAMRVALELGRVYEETEWCTTQETLLIPGHAPDPDCWVVRRAAVALEEHGRVIRYHTSDCLLVVEVGDATETDDLGLMAQIYGAAGIANYWVATRQGIFVHGAPYASGYRLRALLGPEEPIPVPGTGLSLEVRQLVAVD